MALYAIYLGSMELKLKGSGLIIMEGSKKLRMMSKIMQVPMKAPRISKERDGEEEIKIKNQVKNKAFFKRRHYG